MQNIARKLILRKTRLSQRLGSLTTHPTSSCILACKCFTEASAESDVNFIYSPECLKCMLPPSTHVSTVTPRGFKPTRLVKIYSCFSAVHVPHFVRCMSKLSTFKAAPSAAAASQWWHGACRGLPSRDTGARSSSEVEQSLCFLQWCLLWTMVAPRHFPQSWPICQWQIPPTGTANSYLDELPSCPIFIKAWKMPAQRERVGGDAVHYK